MMRAANERATERTGRNSTVAESGKSERFLRVSPFTMHCHPINNRITTNLLILVPYDQVLRVLRV